MLCIFLLLNHHTYSTIKAQPTGDMGFRGFFVLIFVEALHGPPSFVIVDVRDCKHVSEKLPPSLFTEQTQIDFSCMLAGLARVNNWLECITFFAIHAWV